MNLIIVIIITFIVISDFLLMVLSQDNCVDLSQCMNKLKILTNDENMAFAHKEEHLDELCAKLSEAVDCVNTFIRRCLDLNSQFQYQAMTNGTQHLIRDLCTKHSPFRKEYLRHAECYHRYQDHYKYCTDRYYKQLDKHSHEDQPTQIKYWCCNFDSHRLCTYDSVLQNCGKDAALLAQNIVVTGGGLLINTHCANYTYSSPECSSIGCTHTINFAMFSLLSIILLLTTLIYNY